MFTRFFQAIRKGRTLYRFLTEESLRTELPLLKGRVLDLASGAASYRPFFSSAATVLHTDYQLREGIESVVDINRDFPFADGAFDAILLANALYILEDRQHFWREARRVLKPGGSLLVYSPFIANEMPEPHDFVRLTHEGLERELREYTWSKVNIVRLGDRFSAAANLLHPFWRYAPIRMFVYGTALLLDRCIPQRARMQHPCPLGYFIRLET